MKRQIVVTIEPHEDGVRCGVCGGLAYKLQGYRCNVFGQYKKYGSEKLRVSACLAAERKLRALVEAGNRVRVLCPRGYTDLQLMNWDRALADMEGEGMSAIVACPKCGIEPLEHWNLGYSHKCHVCGTVWSSEG